MELAGFAFDFKCNHLHARTNPVPPLSPSTAAAIGWVPLLWPAKCSEDDLGTSMGCRLEALTGATVNGPNFRGNLEALEQSVGRNRFWPDPGWLWDQRSANRLSP
jgi:hypothetical protein